jgi:hypothetical protein
MFFECMQKTGKRKEKWHGNIAYFRNYGSHVEILIQSRSSIMVLFGKTSRGFFASIPDFDSGCHLVNPKDIFWNTEKLSGVLGKVDGITVATALYTLADELMILQNLKKSEFA